MAKTCNLVRKLHYGMTHWICILWMQIHEYAQSYNRPFSLGHKTPVPKKNCGSKEFLPNRSSSAQNSTDCTFKDVYCVLTLIVLPYNRFVNFACHAVSSLIPIGCVSYRNTVQYASWIGHQVNWHLGFFLKERIIMPKIWLTWHLLISCSVYLKQNRKFGGRIQTLEWMTESWLEWHEWSTVKVKNIESEWAFWTKSLGKALERNHFIIFRPPKTLLVYS